MRKRWPIALALLAVFAGSWVYFKGTVHTGHGLTLVEQGPHLPLPGLHGGSARTVTITDTPAGCLGVDGVPAAWPHGTKLVYSGGHVEIEYDGARYRIGDQVDISGLSKAKPRAQYTLWIPGIPHRCGAMVQPIPDGFSAAS